MKPVLIIAIAVVCSVVAVFAVIELSSEFVIWQTETHVEKLERFIEIGYLCDKESKYIDKAECKSLNYHETKNYMISVGEVEQFDALVQLYPDSFCYNHPQADWYCGKTWMD